MFLGCYGKNLKGKCHFFNVLDTFWKIQMGSCLLFAAVIYSIKQNVKVATDGKVFFVCVETQISGHIYQGKDCVTILPMHNENTNENTIFSFIASFFSPKPLPNKKTQDLKKRAKLMNYESSCTRYVYSDLTYKSRGQKKKTRYFPS